MKRYTFRLIIIVLGVILINSCGSKKSTLRREQILGYWKTIIGENEYVQFEKVDSEYVYSAFSYDRLAASGTWELEGGNLILSFDDGSTTQLKVRLAGDTLIFNDGVEKYVRTVISGDAKTLVGDIGDVEILEAIIKNVNSVFSEAEPFNENWATPNIKWQKITTEVVLKNEGFTEMADVANKISKYLVTQGFDVDTTRISEIITAYKKGKLCVMIRTRSSKEPAAGETTYIDVISGIENK